jgi:Holliday junction DNA helicase RuvB
MEDGVVDLPAGKRVLRVRLPRFTLLAATTHPGRLPKPLLDRFGFVWELGSYTVPEMQTIVARSAGKLGVAIDDAGAFVIARASRGTPRIANRLLRRVRDVAVNAAADGAIVVYGDRAHADGTINGPLAIAALDRLGIDQLGLDQLDRRYLAIVSDGSIGIEAICAELAVDRATIEDVVEPHLLQAGLIRRSRRGRVATPEGRAHVRHVGGAEQA